MKKILIPAILLFLTGCGLPVTIPDIPSIDSNTVTDLLNTSDGDYVSVMTTDPDGFVRFPGEPTRESRDYYIVEDICGQFTTQFMEGVTGRKIIKIENSEDSMGGTYACHYVFAGENAPTLNLVLNYLSVADQKKGQEFLDRKITVSPEIPMENFIATQADGNTNAIYLVLGPEKFIRIDRSSVAIATNDELMIYATKIAQKIKNYK